MESINFDELGLSRTVLEAISKKGFKVATEIQARVIPLILEQKYDVIGIAQTGTGKTGAFGMPIIDLIKVGGRAPKGIVLAPTRELALQVSSELKVYGAGKKLRVLTVYGGAPVGGQIRALERGVDIVVGTPGRVVDLIKRGVLVLDKIDFFVLDEADEMLKMGFVDDIEFVLRHSAKNKRVFLFSATIPDRIRKLSRKYMGERKVVEVKKSYVVNKLIAQEFCRLRRQGEKVDVLMKLIDTEEPFYGIVFCKTKAGANQIASCLRKRGKDVGCIHGDVAQSKRERVLRSFKRSRMKILVATDVAARGLDVRNLSHVVNFDLPANVDVYTHRIGRTGRAGNKGKAISLVTRRDMRFISEVERTLKTKVKEHPGFR